MSKIPKFKNEIDAARFWDTHDTTEFLSQMQEVRNVKFPIPRHKSVVVDIEAHDMDSIKKIATRKNVPFHTLIQHWIKEKISGELKTVK